jgi:hypothetical protein
MRIPLLARFRCAASLLCDGFLPSLTRSYRILFSRADAEGSGGPLSARRCLTLSLFIPLFGAIQLVHWFCHLLDELLFPDYRGVPISRPVFILGMPRSGTTLLHRALAQSAARFTTPRAWELWFAPSIVQRRLITSLGRLDRRLNNVLGRALRRLQARAFGGLDGIHDTALDHPEEDYFFLTPLFACFLLAIALPQSRLLWALARFDVTVPADERRRIVGFYRLCLQKHLYAAGAERRVLSKNASFISWRNELAAAFPDGRFIVCVRHPLDAVPSLLAAVEGGARLFDSAGRRPDLQDELIAMMQSDWDGVSAAAAGRVPPLIVRLETLRADLGREVLRVLEACEEAAESDLRQRLSAQSERARRYQSRAGADKYRTAALEQRLLPSIRAYERIREACA